VRNSVEASLKLVDIRGPLIGRDAHMGFAAASVLDLDDLEVGVLIAELVVPHV
jgi:hypothetical protein